MHLGLHHWFLIAIDTKIILSQCCLSMKSGLSGILVDFTTLCQNTENNGNERVCIGDGAICSNFMK